MADPILHLKDAYFFEVPRFLWPRHFQSRREFPDVWVRLDDEFQLWEARRLCEKLPKLVQDLGLSEPSAPAASEGGSVARVPSCEMLLRRYQEWKHDHANFGKPFRVYLEEWRDRFEADYRSWVARSANEVDRSPEKFLEVCRQTHRDVEHYWFVALARQPGFASRWKTLCAEAGDVAAYKADPSVAEWSREKLAAYNHHLSGKILIPQPFGVLRNLHEPQSGVCISKYMIIEFLVLLVIFIAYRWLAVRAAQGGRPKGKCWNLLEALLSFVRDHIARPAMGGHDADRFVPLLWSIFLFILGCNLFGMIPGFGAPTSVWGNTLAMALVTFSVGVFCGMRRFGVVGFFLNQVPHMEIPLWIALFIKPPIFLIEMLSLMIKHLVLSIRLLANMVAGHLVLQGVLAVAFGAEAALQWQSYPTWQWSMAAVIAVTGSALFSVLELFVAFLQAFIFTFLSALFIGAAIHHH